MKDLVDHARFHHRLKVGGIDFKDAVEAFHAQRDSAVDGNGAAAQACARRGRSHRNLVLVGPAQHRGHFFGRPRAQHYIGEHAQVFGFVVRKIRTAFRVN